MQRIAILFTVSLAIIFSSALHAHAQGVPPSAFSFQGRLAAADGPVDGTVNVRFRLFDTASDGTALWSEDHDGVNVQGGAFSAVLGASAPITTAMVNHTRLYLEVAVDGETLSPRMSLVSVPYALRADDANTVGGLSATDLQRRVTATCDVGSSIRAINADGSVTCESDDVGEGGGIGQITAGLGLSGGGAGANVSLGINTAVVQQRVGSTCAAGSSIRAISASGTVTCESDDSGQSIAAGTGINVNTSGATATVSADSSYLQRRVSGSCADGAIRSIASNGTVTCAATEVDPTDFNGSTPVATSYSEAAVFVAESASAYTTLTSVTITAPRGGYVMLTGTSAAFCWGCTTAEPTTRGFLGWTTSSSGIPVMRALYFSKLIPHGTTGPSGANPTALARFAVAAGTHTFYLRARTQDPSTFAHMHIQATGMFIPN